MITLFKDPFFDVMGKVFETSGGTINPQTRIRKTDGEYKLLLSVPGLTKDDLKISTKDGILKISFEKQPNDGDLNFIDGFTKIYTIPDEVREKDILGRVENGVLEIRLPIDKKKNIERLISLN
jgi:HSP20 family molecular chaperone IbpA